MPDLASFLIDRLPIVTVDIVILVGLLTIFRKTIFEWISSRVRAKNQSFYNQQLETHKAELTRENELYLLETKNQLEQMQFLKESIRISFSEGQKSSMERRLQAIDQIWSETISIRSVVPPSMIIVDALKINEKERNRKILNHELTENMNWSIDEYKDKMQSISKSVEECRPYVGELIWVVFFAYQVLHVRVSVIFLQMKLINVDDRVKWYKDETIHEIISTILDEGELETFNNLEYGKFFWLRRKLEQKLLTQMNKIISGELYGDDAQQNFATTVIEKLEKIDIESEHDQLNIPH